MNDETAIDRDVKGIRATFTREGLWSELMPTYDLTNADITCVTSEDELISRRGITIQISEGRSPIYVPEEKGEPGWAALQYRLDFSTGYGPDEVTFEKAKIWIKGRHPNGQAIEIRGRGYVFDDPTGDLVGEFLKPPEILIERVSND